MQNLREVYGTPAPQSEPIVGREDEMIVNNAGGYVFGIDGFAQLERFLVLGTEGGTYYVEERPLTLENAKNLRKCVEEDGIRAVNTIVDFSHNGRIPKNSTALFGMATALTFGDNATKQAVVDNLPKVARTGSHLQEFVEYANTMRGWGRAMKRAVNGWYQNQSLLGAVYQTTKYRTRVGWSHRDVLRKGHPKNDELNSLFRYITQGDMPQSVIDEYSLIEGYEKAKVATTAEEVASLVQNYGLTREMVPSEYLSDPLVLRALAQYMPLTAMIRNLGNLTKAGVVAPMSDIATKVVNRVTDVEQLKKARIHPIQVLSALSTYSRGRGFRGSNEWTPVQPVVDALDEAVELSFEAVPPTGKRFYVGVDVSGSMAGSWSFGIPGLAPRDAAGVMALVVARRERNYHIAGFSGGMRPLNITARDSVKDTLEKTRGLPFDSTDCALPMLDATEKRIPADVFLVITDNETWAGSIHPVDALKKYRRQMGIDAKCVVVAMTSTGFSIADPSDPGMMDVVGFDASVPQVIANFVK